MARLDMWLTDDLAGILRGLVVSAAAMPAGEYRQGFLAALAAVGVSVGTDTGQSRRVIDATPAPAVPAVFEDLNHDSVPFPFAAFANLGR